MARTTVDMKAAWKDPVQRAKMSRRPSLAKRQIRIQKKGEVDCAKCGAVKPLSEFPKTRQKRSGQPRFAYCKTCHTAYNRGLRLKRFFNLTVQEYNAILRHQGKVCAICGNPPRTMRLAVDHNHKTGLVRGLLCTFCNRVLGLFRDDVQRFERLLAYIHDPPATKALKGERYGIKGRTSNKAATRKRLNKGHMFDKPKRAA